MDQDHGPQALPLDDEGRVAFWTQHIQAWQQSGLSQAAYVQQHRLPLARFGYWKRKLDSKASQSGFARVTVAPGTAPVRIHHRSGTLIECQPGTDVHWLQELLGMHDAS
ncbi:MAG: hypothetical protein WD601_08435 [Pseudohongiellaceae bacterium]